MPFVTVNCPSCGGEIQLDNTRAFGFCLYCGNKIINSEKPTDFEELFTKALSAYKDGNYSKAFEFFNTVTRFDPYNWKAILLRDYSKCLISPYKDDPLPIAIENTNKIYSITKENIPDTFERENLETELLQFICVELCHLVDIFNKKWYKYLEPDPEFENFESFTYYLRDLYNGIDGYENCISLIKESKNQEAQHLLERPYNSIYFFLNLLSKHHKITNGKWVSIDSQERKRIVAKYDEIKLIFDEFDNAYRARGIGITRPSEKKYQIERNNVEAKNL